MIYIYNEEENIINFDINNKLSLLKIMISNNYDIKPEDFNMIYEGKNLHEEHEKTTIKDIILDNKYPIFYVKHKSKKKILKKKS